MKGTDVPVPIINSAIGKHVHGHKPSGSVSERIALFQRLQNTSSSTTSPIVESKVRITPRRLSAGRMPKWIGHPHPTVSSSGTATIDKTNITNEADMATLSKSDGNNSTSYSMPDKTFPSSLSTASSIQSMPSISIIPSISSASPTQSALSPSLLLPSPSYSETAVILHDPTPSKPHLASSEPQPLCDNAFPPLLQATQHQTQHQTPPSPSALSLPSLVASHATPPTTASLPCPPSSPPTHLGMRRPSAVMRLADLLLPELHPTLVALHSNSGVVTPPCIDSATDINTVVLNADETLLQKIDIDTVDSAPKLLSLLIVATCLG
ncbi:hypothetical protein BSLG_003383 [Batrachochytrium salamandrivorans]|nr:hypothetical protein BSLG_003383 [Batrachochytrium salamandrivorans]